MIHLRYAINSSRLFKLVSIPELAINKHLSYSSSIIARKPRDPVVNNFLLSKYQCGLIQCFVPHRQYAKYIDDEKRYTKVYDFSYTGDREIKQSDLDLSKPRPGFEEEYKRLEEEGGNDMVKRLITLEFADKKEKDGYRMQKIMQKLKAHPLDNDSIEEKVVHQTIRIRAQIQHFLKNRKDRRAKHFVLCRANHRANLLTRLREVDREHFEWMSKDFGLKILHKDPFFNHKSHHKRGRRIDVARKAYIRLKKDKVTALKEQYAEEYRDWQVEKMQKLPAIIDELTELGVRVDNVDDTLVRIGLPRCNPEVLSKQEIKKRRLLKLMHRFGKNKEQARLRGQLTEEN